MQALAESLLQVNLQQLAREGGMEMELRYVQGSNKHARCTAGARTPGPPPAGAGAPTAAAAVAAPGAAATRAASESEAQPPQRQLQPRRRGAGGPTRAAAGRRAGVPAAGTRWSAPPMAGWRVVRLSSALRRPPPPRTCAASVPRWRPPPPAPSGAFCATGTSANLPTPSASPHLLLMIDLPCRCN